MTDTVILQRIRNRIIELLDWYSDESKFRSAISNIEMWEDWVRDNDAESFEHPVFTQEEIASLKPVSVAWENISLDTKQTDTEWVIFSRKCAEALTILNKRGLLSETVAIT
jgi:hypothetical protein